MAHDTDIPAAHDGKDDVPRALEEARREVARALATAGDGEGEDLVKPGAAGYSIELRFNGETIALGGEDVARLSPDAFKPFLHDHKVKVEAGDYDREIERALGQPGPGKALARVRAVD